jgi:peptidoglycan/xylan/chitin deacetylase (PgdA/CDA1 family)
MMQPNVAAIWRRIPPDLDSRIEKCIRAGCEKAEGRGVVYLFFRADDAAVPGRQFSRMMDLFSAHGVPLSLAVVPAWLTLQRWQYLNGFEKKNPSGWCWHQHGWRHANHETEGKKQEFGDARAVSEIKRDLEQGKHRLEQLMEDRFYPVFTPPWNRCGSSTLQLLKDLRYAAVSRSRGSKTAPPAGLPDYCINVDLHTRKEKDPAAGWKNLFAELHQALASNYCGIMIHHRMMNAAALDFLKVLLKALTKNHKLQPIHFKDLAGKKIY